MTDTRHVPKPDWVSQVDTAPAFDLDVDALLRAGEFPLTIVQDHLADLGADGGGVLRSSFDPSPLIRALERGGYDCWTSEDCTGKTILRVRRAAADEGGIRPSETLDSDEGERFWLEGEELHMDVRQMPPPMPMIAILEFLDSGAHEGAVFVHTPHFPVHLLPELEERHVQWQLVTDQPNESILRLTRDTLS